MNWYKKIIILSAKRTFIPRTFLDRLKDFGVVVERVSNGGSNVILLNTNNNQRSNFHGHKGKDVDSGAIREMLKDLGIDYWGFYDPNFMFRQQNIEEEEEEEVPEYQKQKWWIEQQKYREPVEV